ncbi:MAG: regulatory protein RecX [Clostridia bacterium]|nr:regulatory protein RecX [Clostridia bacterium]
MIITDIIPERKKLSAVYIDGEYAMKLDTNVLDESCIKKGMEIDDDALRELIETSDYKRAKEKALWLLSGQDYSRGGLARKLMRESSEETVEKVCDRMEELGLINDEDYARRLGSDLLNIKKMSKRGAVYKLMEKGIDRSLAEEVLEEFDVDPVEQICELIERKYSQKLEDEKDRRRTIAALQRLGYSWGDIKDAISCYLDD